MSRLRVVNQGEQAFFDSYFAVAAIGGGHAVRLFTNEVEAGLTSGQLDALTETDFTEADFAGYSPVVLPNAGSWTVTPADPTEAVGDVAAFTRSSTGTAQLVWGYYLTLENDDSLQWYEQFDGPVSIEFEDDQFRVTPVLTLEDEGGGVSTGDIKMTGSSATPTGWLYCDGSEVSRADFAALFAAIGTAYGVGDGSTTFGLPDLRQRFPMGQAASGTGSTLGATGGAIDHVHGLETSSSGARLGTETSANILYHDRKTVAAYTSNVVSTAGTVAFEANASGRTLATALTGDSDWENPPFQTVRFLIKA